MHMSKPALIVALVLLAGCGGSKAEEPQADVSVVRPGAPGKASQEVSAEELKEPDTVKPIAQDIVFMRGMIHHHQQAIRMTGWVPERTQSPAVKLMAERMAATQSGEIERYEKWLGDRGFDAGHGHGADELMPGMLTDAQLERLEAAEGKSFDRLFLRYMTRHHLGAITMVRDLYAEGGGQETELDFFARHIEADQEIEIKRMQDVLAKL
jgi:uncharacterized protein (DUF305 family)